MAAPLLAAIPKVLSSLVSLYFLYQGAKGAKDTYSSYKKGTRPQQVGQNPMTLLEVPPKVVPKKPALSTFGKLRALSKAASGNKLNMLFGAMSLASLLGEMGGQEEQEMPPYGLAGTQPMLLEQQLDPQMLMALQRMGQLQPNMPYGGTSQGMDDITSMMSMLGQI